MTCELICWGENTQIQLIDELGVQKSVYVRTRPMHGIQIPSDCAAEQIFWFFIVISAPPLVGGPFAHLNPNVIDFPKWKAEAEHQLGIDAAWNSLQAKGES